MKKQFLFLAFFTLALIFAGTNKGFGQALLPGVTKPGVTAPLVTQPLPPLLCAASSTLLPLHPFPGVAYTYAMTNGGGATSLNWTWWATKNPNFVTPGATPTLNLGTQLTVASNALLATSADYGADNRGGANGTNSVSITWSANILAATDYQGNVTAAGTPADPSPTFVVGYSEGAAGCTDNIEVFEINPLPNFTIAIAPIDTAVLIGNKTLGWGATVDQCVDNVQSAIYNNTSKALDMDYGKNNFYFEVAATNFNTNWNPAFTVLSGLQEGQTAEIRLYASLNDAITNTNAIATSPLLHDGNVLTAPTGATPTFTWDPDLTFTASVPADAATGVSVYVRVTVYNGTYESLAANPFELAVDARDFNNAGIWDMEDDDCPGGSGTNTADGVDTAIHNITPRPTLEMNGTIMNEANSNDPDDVIIKTQVPKP